MKFIAILFLAVLVLITPAARSQDPNQTHALHVATLSADDMRQMTQRNIAQIVGAVSLLTSDLSRMTSGSGSSRLGDISVQLKSLGDSAANAGAGIEPNQLRQINSTLQDQLRSPMSTDVEFDTTNAMFNAHTALLAGNIANFAATLNTAALTGQSQFNVSQGRARDFVDEAARILRRTQTLTSHGSRSDSGMIGETDTWRSGRNTSERYRHSRYKSSDRMYGSSFSNSTGSSGATSGLGSARDSSASGQIGTTSDPQAGRGSCLSDYSAPPVSARAGTSTSRSTTDTYTSSRSGMIGASMGATMRRSDVTLHDMAALMRQMGNTMQDNNRDVLIELGDITDNIAMLHSQAVDSFSRFRQSTSTNIGSSDVYIGTSDVLESEYESGATSGRTDIGFGAGTGSVEATRNFNRGPNTAGTSTGTGVEIGRRDWDQ